MDTRDTDRGREQVEPRVSPAQQYALFAGAFVLALGLLALLAKDLDFGGVGPGVQSPEFLLWPVNGWIAAFWIVMGATGVLMAGRSDAARLYAASASLIFAVVAVWGAILGTDVAGVLVAGTADNVTHAALAGLGLLAAVTSHPTGAAQEANQPERGPSPPLGRDHGPQRARRERIAGRR